MARIDLNIIDRGTGNTYWSAENGPLKAEQLDEVMEQKTDNSGALNSLPTPFARFFVAREAFRRVTEERINSDKEAGIAYSQMVSDILDVYELLFNLTFHNNKWKRGEKLELREWDSKENLLYLKEKMPVLFNSVNSYYGIDINESKLYFLIFTENGKESLLACSSPYTGFITPPDLDKKKEKKNGTIEQRFFAGEQYKDLHIFRKSGGEYFRDIKLFEERDVDFKNYMYTLFGSDDVNEQFRTIKEYIQRFKHDKDIQVNYVQRTVSVKTDQNNDLVVNGLSILSLNEIDVNSYFTEELIRLPYRISTENFQGVTYQNDQEGRNYDYLLPFKPEVFSLFPGKNIDSDVHIGRNSVTVYLRYNGKEYQKEYAKDVISHRDGLGRIKDLQEAKINFDLGLFPNILSYKEKENNYFKVMVIGTDEDPDAPNFNIERINLTFYKNEPEGLTCIHEHRLQDNAKFGVLPAVIRSQQQFEDKECGTKFYELFDTSFDIVEIKLFNKTSGLIIPKWKKSKQTKEAYTYAIDLGTSNTFMSRCRNNENGTPDLSRKPELFKMGDNMVSYLHANSTDLQFSQTRRIENAIFAKGRKNIKTEFVPAIIDGLDYKFPIRTALCGIRDKSRKPKLFDNHNIAFFYEKMMANDDQEIYTDIKWNDKEDLLRIFVQELLLIIKCDVLQHNGDLDRTNIVWFSPLSFSVTEQDIYQDVWRTECLNILSIPKEQIRQYSESEAPYYYYKYMNYIANSDAVTVIDIGGGSTDFVYFQDNKPLLANSVHFGCDVLWENGFIAFENERQNGIYQRYAKTLQFSENHDLEKLNESFMNVDSVKTKDIINFWLSNDRDCNITKLLRNDFRPLFVFHLTTILFYMSHMYLDNKLEAPRTIVFSGNGSRYIDNFISQNMNVIKQIISMVFKQVFGGEHNINLKLPEERKESTCYGGLYREPDASNVDNVIYQGDGEKNYQTVGDMNKNLSSLKNSLLIKYKDLASLYGEVLSMLKQQKAIDNMIDTSKYLEMAEKDMGESFDTHYKTQVKEKFADEDYYNDSVFFLPIIDRIFNMTKI